MKLSDMNTLKDLQIVLMEYLYARRILSSPLMKSKY